MISSSRSGRKTLTSGRLGDVEQPLDRRPVDAHRLRLPGREADRQLVQAVLALARENGASRAGAEAHHLALVAGAARAARAAEVQALEQVRLAGPVRAGHDRQPVADLDVGIAIAAEVAQAQAERPAAYPLRRSAGSA